MVAGGTAEAGGTGVWIAIETSTPVGSLAVWRDGLALELSLGIQGTHSERLLPAIDYALRTTGIEADRISSVVVGAGPGSFTGVRVSAAMAKGWAIARSCELYAYSSLLACAAGSGSGVEVCAMFDARRGEVYAGCYRIDVDGPEELMPPGVWPVPRLLEELGERRLDPVFSGGGALRYAEALTEVQPGARILPAHLAFPRAATLLWLRSIAPGSGRVERPEGWEPIYVRDWRITTGGEG